MRCKLMQYQTEMEDLKEKLQNERQLNENYKAQNNALREILHRKKIENETDNWRYLAESLREENNRLRRREVELTEQLEDAAAEMKEFVQALQDLIDRDRAK